MCRTVFNEKDCVSVTCKHSISLNIVVQVSVDVGLER